LTVPSALVSTVSAPIRAMQSAVGRGWSDDPFTDPGAVAARARDALTDVSAAIRRTWNHVHGEWSGSGADGAADFMATTVAAIDGLAARADRLSATARTAADAVARAHERLRAIIDNLEARAAALEPYLDHPAVSTALTEEAQRSLGEAVAVVEELQQELDGHAATMTTSSAPVSLPAPMLPAGLTSPAAHPSPVSSGMPSMPGMGSSFSGIPSVSPLSGAGGTGLGGLLGDLIGFAPQDGGALRVDPASFGDGVAVRLPDGSTATAPNAVAANAVRYALTQLGVPYDWGGTTPGVGLDCSGLTQWAYHEAGLNLPRLAQEQDVGARVEAGALRPGDLAVWDGHVAMIVGNGTMIEAGDPVKLSPIRMTNAGQGFQGFWRPTA
jgi:peptidoglycan DL-endopeptidase CwlO